MRPIALVALLFAAFALSCRERPKAPALRDEPVYDNPHVGLRLMSPAGWTQVARTDRPPPVNREHMLVRYQSASGSKPALFEVTMQELPESTNIGELVKSPSHSLGPWTEAGAAESVAIGGRNATRYSLTQKDMAKESSVVRRGPNLFVFTLVAPKSEVRLREQIRQVLAEVVWTN